MKLQSMTDFVLKQNEILGTFENFRKIVYNYANFLKQPLTLGMFVPCNEDGNVLEEPLHVFSDHTEKEKSLMYQSNYLTIEYQQAKERCLFFSQHGNEETFGQCLARVYLDEFFNIEQLSNEIRNIELTQTTIKELGL